MPRARKEVNVEWLRSMWTVRNKTVDDLAAALGISPTHVRRIARANNFPARIPSLRKYNAKAHQRFADPTPEEIAERCAEVRAKRASSEGSGWELPTYSYDHRRQVFY